MGKHSADNKSIVKAFFLPHAAFEDLSGIKKFGFSLFFSLLGSMFSTLCFSFPPLYLSLVLYLLLKSAKLITPTIRTLALGPSGETVKVFLSH